MRGKKPRPCPDVAKLRRMANSGEYGMNQLCEHFGTHIRAMHRWLSDHGIERPRGIVESLDGEEWRPVVGFEGRYEVSNLGRVRGVDRWTGNKFFRSQIIQPGKKHPDTPYHIVCLTVNGKGRMRRVHSLVLEAFVGPRPKGMEACHNNGDREDNRLENLRWDTHRANMEDQFAHGTKQRKQPRRRKQAAITEGVHAP